MKISDASKKMILIIGILMLIIIAAGAVYYRSLSVLPFALGAFLGSALNAFKLIMLERTVGRVVEMGDKEAGNYMRFQYLLRFLLTGLVLVASAIWPFINLWGTAFGIFTLQIAAFSMRFFPDKNEKTDQNA